jgi:Family of unknown function (DUF6580)
MNSESEERKNTVLRMTVVLGMIGLAACYLAGLPLFWNTLAGDAVYTAAMFGGFALAERMVPQLREAGGVKAR